MRRGRGLLVLALIAGSAARARAEEALPLALEWQAPPECYSADEIRAELSRIAHVRPGRAPAELSARGRIEKEGEAYRLVLTTELNGVAGERSLVARDCRALGREVTLVLALSFGEGVELVPDEPAEAAPDAKPEAAPVPPKKPAKAAPPVAASALAGDESDADRGSGSTSRRGRRLVFAGGGVLFGVFPSAAPQVFLGGELGTERYWLSLRALALPQVKNSLERDVDARYDGLGAALSPCFGDRAIAVCALVSAAAVRGRSAGATESGSATAPWYAAGASASVAVPASSVVFARLEASLLVSLNRPRFVVGGLGEAHELPRFVPGVSLGLGLGSR